MGDSIMDTMSDYSRLEEFTDHFREMENKLAELAQEKECELKTNKDSVTDNRTDAEFKKMVNNRLGRT